MTKQTTVVLIGSFRVKIKLHHSCLFYRWFSSRNRPLYRQWIKGSQYLGQVRHGAYGFNIGIKHGFLCINIRQVPWEVLKTEAEGRVFQHLPRDLANVIALKNHVRSLLLHKN